VPVTAQRIGWDKLQVELDDLDAKNNFQASPSPP
jgi:hypothetical protein